MRPASRIETDTADTVVVGGGIFGIAIAYGLQRLGCDTLVLDGGDDALRAARGNFGLVWVQTKGMGMQRYTDWSRESAGLWGDFAAELEEGTGIGVAHRNDGGLQILVGEEEREERRRQMDIMRQQAGPEGYDCEIIEPEEVRQMLPKLRIGDTVTGASFCPHDGDVNPLRLLRALHAGFREAGGHYRPESEVVSIRREGDGFVAETETGPVSAAKLVLAAGHGAPRLASMVGLDVPVRPQRGQVLVTERAATAATAAIPVATMRRTDEGGFLLGNSEEDVGFDNGTTLAATARIARRAVAAFPDLAGLNLVRSWGCIRVLTPDGAAIYDESEACPGAYSATSHSGITLAAANARLVARWIAGGEKPDGFDAFSARRFAPAPKVA